MAHFIVQATAAELGQGETTDLGDPRWLDRGGGTAIMSYEDKGIAYVYGPIVLGNPNKHYYEVQCENVAVEAEVLSRVAEMESMKTLARNNGLMRAFIATTDRPRIKNSSGNVVGYYPVHVKAGTNPREAFLDGEDVEAAQELPDLGQG